MIHRKPLTIALLIMVLTLIVSACAAPAAPATADQPAAEADASAAQTEQAAPEALVDTQWVLDNLEDPNVRLIDVGRSLEDYEAGHIPGAVYINTGDDLTNPEDSTRGQILTQDAFSAVMSRIGIEPDDTVVLYDNASNLLSTRAYWVFKYYQHENAKVYNGGSPKWVADGQELTTDTPEITPTEYVAQDPDLALRTTTEYVLEHIDDPGVVMCDTRNPEEFTGTDVRAARGGHIPGAINVEWTNAVNDDGTFKDLDTLRELYTAAGFTPDKQIITYCQTGVRGAHTWFVLSEMLDYPDVRNYDGSWEEYGNRDDTPIDS